MLYSAQRSLWMWAFLDLNPSSADSNFLVSFRHMQPQVLLLSVEFVRSTYSQDTLSINIETWTILTQSISLCLLCTLVDNLELSNNIRPHLIVKLVPLTIQTVRHQILCNITVWRLLLHPLRLTSVNATRVVFDRVRSETLGLLSLSVGDWVLTLKLLVQSEGGFFPTGD